ncbi:MAG: outer membrane beta-barrel protein [Pseudomonadales bacterium]
MFSRKWVPVLVSGVLAAAGAGSAAADENTGLYLGGSLGYTTFSASENVDVGEGFQKIKVDDSDMGWKLFAGYQFLPWLGVEAGYVDLGDVSDNALGATIDASTDGWDAFLVGTLPLPLIDLFAKVGMVSWNVDADVSDGVNSINLNDDGEDLAYGVGAALDLEHFAIRAEIERFDISDVDDLYMFSVGATIQF